MAVTCCQSFEIAKVQNIPVSEFVKDFLNAGRPVVIEGALEDWPASKWTLQSLKDRVGSREVNVRVNTNCEEYRAGRQYSVKQIKFGRYIDDLIAGNARSRNSYLAVQNVKKALPELQEDVPLPPYIGKLHGGPYMWIAPKGHYEYCHFDPDDGMLMMISGRKQVRLFGCDLQYMYPNRLGSKGRTVQSQVNCDDPDLTLHPRFPEATCQFTTLGPGQMLYIPAFWWHQVTSIEQAISVNIFWGDAGTNTYLTKVMAEPRWPTFRHWLLNIVEQNRDFESFPKVLSRLPESLRNFIKSQWHEEPTAEQMDVLISAVMTHLNIEELPREKSAGKHPPPFQIRGLLWRS